MTESRARQYFPNKSPQEVLSQTITYITYRDTITRSVTGVVADLQGPTEFFGKEFCPLPSKAYSLVQWTNTNGSDRLYLQLKANAIPSHVLAVIQQLVDNKSREFEQKQTSSFKFKRWFELLPLRESHFSTYIEEYDGVHKANKKVLYGLLGVAAFLLALACINYINMGVASIPQRAKEIGVRKTLGSSRFWLIGEFLAETFITAVLACAVAFFLGWAEFKLLRGIVPDDMSLSTGILPVASFAVALSLIVTVFSGIYPGWLITKVKTIQVFRHAFVLNTGTGRIGLQKALIVFQFSIAIAFITGAMIVGRQLRYVLDSDMGFNKDAVVLAEVPFKYAGNPSYKGRQFTLLNELRAIPGVANVSLGEPPLSRYYNSGTFKFYQPGKEPLSRLVYRKRVDTGYLRLYGIHLLAGRNLNASDTTDEVVINETAVKAFQLGSPQDAIGKIIGEDHQSMVPIVGVVRDFHTQNFYTTIDPVAMMSQKEDLSTFNIKLDNTHVANWPETLRAIEKKWYAFYPPESFSYKFYDQTIEEMYKSDRNLSLLIKLATGISIFISCLGLFGLAVLTAFQRTREIGIRKVLGASVGGIVLLLSRDYVRLILFAILIATPIAWWAMNKWMQNFAYRTALHWWLFVLTGFLGLAIAFLTVASRGLIAARANPVKTLRTE